MGYELAFAAVFIGIIITMFVLGLLINELRHIPRPGVWFRIDKLWNETTPIRSSKIEEMEPDFDAMELWEIDESASSEPSWVRN